MGHHVYIKKDLHIIVSKLARRILNHYVLLSGGSVRVSDVMKGMTSPGGERNQGLLISHLIN